MGLITLMKASPGVQQGQPGRQEPLFHLVDTLKDTLRILPRWLAASPPLPKRWNAPPRAATPPPPTWLTALLTKKGLLLATPETAAAHVVKAATAHQVDLLVRTVSLAKG
jgi:hypothetical protein